MAEDSRKQKYEIAYIKRTSAFSNIEYDGTN